MMVPGLLLFMAISAPQVHNPGFEARTLSDWQVDTEEAERKGASAQLDTTEVKEGRQSLRLEAKKPASLRMAQWTFLPAGTLWRAHVWVKTEGLSSKAGPGGIIQIDSREGTLGRSRPRSGTSDWQEESVLFEAPTPEDVELVLVGFDKGAGKVWFDGLRLEPVSRPEEKEVQILFKKASHRPID